MSATLPAKDKPQTLLSQLKTFSPSNMPNGMRLKVAIQALNHAMVARLRAMLGEATDVTARIVARTMLVAGPAIAVFPIVFWSVAPATITAPGDMNLKGNGMEIAVIKAPIGVSLNSAHKPYFCATIL